MGRSEQSVTYRRPAADEGLPAPSYFVQYRHPGGGDWHRCANTHTDKYAARQQLKRYAASHPGYTVRLVQFGYRTVDPQRTRVPPPDTHPEGTTEVMGILTPEGFLDPAEERLYRFTFDPGGGIGETTWIRSLDQLLTPNGTEPLLVFMLRELDRTGRGFVLSPYTPTGDR